MNIKDWQKKKKKIGRGAFYSGGIVLNPDHRWLHESIWDKMIELYL